jgi:hypothetical protein
MKKSLKPKFKDKVPLFSRLETKWPLIVVGYNGLYPNGILCKWDFGQDTMSKSWKFK